jgi:hypothetical protein
MREGERKEEEKMPSQKKDYVKLEKRPIDGSAG